MKKFAILVVFTLCYTSIIPIAAETPEMAEGRIAGENDAKGFQWKWFAISYIMANSSFIVCVGSLVSTEACLYPGLENAIGDSGSTFCWAALGTYTFIPTAIALIHSPAPPPTNRFLGKSPDWINSYTNAYKKRKKRDNVVSSGMGCVLGGTVLFATLATLGNLVGFENQ